MDNWNYEELRQRITKVPTTAVSDALDSIGLMNNTVCGLFPTWNCGPVFERLLPDHEELRKMRESCEQFDKSDSSKNIFSLINSLLERQKQTEA